MSTNRLTLRQSVALVWRTWRVFEIIAQYPEHMKDIRAKGISKFWRGINISG